LFTAATSIPIYVWRKTSSSTRKLFSECSDSIKNFAEFPYREHDIFHLRPFFTNSDWKLIGEREQANFQYKYIKIPWQCDNEVEFVLPYGGTYSCTLMPQEICQLAAVSGLMDRYLEDANNDEENWESSSESSNDEEEDEELRVDDELREDPMFREVNEMMEKNGQLVTENEHQKENRQHLTNNVSKDFTIKGGGKRNVKGDGKQTVISENDLTIGSGDSAKERGTKVSLEDICRANILSLQLLLFGTRKKETVWLLSIEMEETRSVLLH
jgi:hypothetical protein